MGVNALEVRRRVMMAQPHEAVASGAVASFRTDVVSALPMEFDLLPIQAGTGDPSPDNIRPITGHDGFTRTGTGANVFGGLPLAEAIHEASHTGNIDTENKTVTFTRGKQHQNGSYAHNLFDKFKPNKQYTVIITAKMRSEGKYNNSLFIRYSNNSISEVTINSTEKTTYVITSESGKSVKWLELSFYTGNECDVYYEESGIFEGVLTADQFASYVGHSYETTFPTPPGTVYGCHIKDNGDGTGTLTVTDKYYVFDGDENWSIAATGTNRAFRFNDAFPDYIKRAGISPYISNWAIPTTVINNVENGGFAQWVFRTTNVSANSNLLVVTPTSDVNMTLDSFKAMLEETPLEICAKLATPVTYTLPLTAIQSLIGQNHIWVDNADEVSVEYWGH